MPITENTLNFLTENRQQNSKDWFHENRPAYMNEVMEPLVELVEALTPAMLDIDPHFETSPKVGKTISRIYRDTRFSRDKSLYRDVMWCGFQRPKTGKESHPGFFLEFSPYRFRYGCGFYQASTEKMRAMREKILDDSLSFLHAQSAFTNQSVFEMEGETFKKIHYRDQPLDKQNWLERRNIFFVHNSIDFPWLFSDDMALQLGENFTLLKPVYDFLLTA